MSTPSAEEVARQIMDALPSFAKIGGMSFDHRARTRGHLQEAITNVLRKHAAAAVAEERARWCMLGWKESFEVEQRNIGASIMAKKLAEIARTGEHAGTFGGEDIEEAAQVILQALLQAKIDAVAIERADKASRGVNAELLEACKMALKCSQDRIDTGKSGVCDVCEIRMGQAIANAEKAPSPNLWRRMPVKEGPHWFCADLSMRACLVEVVDRGSTGFQNAQNPIGTRIKSTDGYWLSIPDERMSAGVEE